MNRLHYSTILLAVVILSSLGMSSCKKNFERLLAVKTTSINSTSFLAQGEVTDVGDFSPEYGFYYSYSPNLSSPAIYKIGTTGSPKTFQASFEGLPANTYYIAAYAKSSQGTVFGDVLKFTVSGGGDVDYYWDNGHSDYGWRINAGYNNWLGNLFPVTTSGIIKSVLLYFSSGTGTGSDMLSVEFFDQNHNSISSTSSFSPIASNWITISGLSVPFNGNFYTMVHWNSVVSPTNYLAMDQTGPNVYMDLGYIHYGSTWTKLSTDPNGNQQPGIFLLRVTAQLTSKEKGTVLTELGPSISPVIQNPGTLKNIKSGSAAQAMPFTK
ncbi:MAG: hypothetical protein NTY96_12820 [Bacteroidetes bacterium]|nr:hypothetical protein [Bacteroidota bacterium]